MKKNIIILFIIASLILIILFVVISNKQNNLKVDNNNNVVVTDTNKNITPSNINKEGVYVNEDYKKGVKHNNVIFCENKLDCLKSLFVNCIRGTDNFIDKSDNLSYSIIINNKSSNGDCNISFTGNDSKNKNYSSYCVIPLKDINDSLFDKILSKKDRSNTKFCN